MYEHCVLLVFVWASDVTVLGRWGVLEQLQVAAEARDAGKADRASPPHGNAQLQEQLRRSGLLVLGCNSRHLRCMTLFTWSSISHCCTGISCLHRALQWCARLRATTVLQAMMGRVEADAAALDVLANAQGSDTTRSTRHDSRQNVRLRAINWVGSTEELVFPGMGASGMGGPETRGPGRKLVLKKQQ